MSFELNQEEKSKQNEKESLLGSESFAKAGILSIESALGSNQDQASYDFYNQGRQSRIEGILPELEISNSSELQSKIEKPGDYKETLMIDGIPRNFHLHVPPGYNPGKPMPLVLALHGHGDDASGAKRISGLNDEADKEGFIVAYPEAVHWFGQREHAAWNTGNGLVPPGTQVDDSAFLRRVIDHCEKQLSIDDGATYLVGFSNGAMEAYKAASDLSDELEAVVAVSGAMSGKETKPEFPISMLSIVGTADKGVPLEGRTPEEEAAYIAPEKMRMLAEKFPLLKNEFVGTVASEILQRLALETGFVPVFKPVTYATDFWKSANGINSPAVISDKDGIRTETYTDPRTGVTVAEKIIDGGDHMIQHGAPNGYNLADDIWTFLSKHRR